MESDQGDKGRREKSFQFDEGDVIKKVVVLGNQQGVFKQVLQQKSQQCLQKQKAKDLILKDSKLIKLEKKVEDIKIDVQIKAQRSLIKLKSKTDIPAMINLKSSGGNRTGVDLICVIDTSGSMEGNKINLLKQTMLYLLKILTPEDRLCIIKFSLKSQKLCGLKAVTDENLPILQNIIRNLQADGGTYIFSGLGQALQTFFCREQTNKVSSIFLLSDGQDTSSLKAFQNSLQLQKYQNLGVVSLHTFGFGKDHNEDLMVGLCKLKDGNFYYIKQQEGLDEAFVAAFGEIAYVVSEQIILKVTEISDGITSGLKIKKTFGKMWRNLNQSQRYREIVMTQMISGVQKYFVFQIQIPYIKEEVQDLQRQHPIIKVQFAIKDMNNKQFKGQSILSMTLLNQNEQISQSTENVEVIENYLRVKTAEVMQEARNLSDNQKHEQASQKLTNMLNAVKNNKRARKQKVEVLIKDLQKLKQVCNKSNWSLEIRKMATQMTFSHQNQSTQAYYLSPHTGELLFSLTTSRNSTLP